MLYKSEFSVVIQYIDDTEEVFFGGWSCNV